MKKRLSTKNDSGDTILFKPPLVLRYLVTVVTPPIAHHSYFITASLSLGPSEAPHDSGFIQRALVYLLHNNVTIFFLHLYEAFFICKSEIDTLLFKKEEERIFSL